MDLLEIYHKFGGLLFRHVISEVYQYLLLIIAHNK